jgi:hypothetical protein
VAAEEVSLAVVAAEAVDHVEVVVAAVVVAADVAGDSL